MKKLLKRLINSISIPPLIRFFITKEGKVNPTWKEIKKDAPDPKNNWARLGLEKTYQFFVPAIVIGFLYYKSKLIEFFINLNSKFDILAYNGDSSPLTIVYQANAYIYLIDNGLTLVGIVYLFYFGYTLFKK